jgi:MinD-like ATPase involved in chromosome partitioning or flagellar assembly
MVKMIAAWGSSGSGKTTVALALAAALAKLKQNIIIISGDLSTPAMPVFIPTEQNLTAKHSLGALLTADKISFDTLKDKIHIHPNSDHIGFMGLVSGETPILYKSFERAKIIELLHILHNSEFNYIIFDCISNPVNDQLTLLAMEMSDFTLRIITPDVKGLEFEKSQLMWLQNAANFRVNKQIKICNQIHEFSPVADVDAVSGGCEYRLPFCGEVYSKQLAGELVANMKYSKGIEFEKQIAALAERINADE